ncbi:MAG: hypothetical protein JXR94_06850 [Candidatus Hydrogenedentes bacterium]|nr:hypothetical protein [Candidatus Hydrogenedentota bacterium]
MTRPQPYVFSFADTALAEAGGVPLTALHRDADAICRCYEAIRPVAERLGVEPPVPRLGGFSYCHVSALGAEVVFAEGSEPNVLPVIHAPEDIDSLREPDDYPSRGVAVERMAVLEELLARRPDAATGIGAHPEGPITTAVLLMGQSFLLLPYEDPERAHRLLSFCVESGLNYQRAMDAHAGIAEAPGPAGICDDFAGMFAPALFAEYVMPAWERVYTGRQATRRHLHSELLRPEHLPFLAELGIAVFDPSADQYVTPEILREQCPVPFTSRILSWEIQDNPPAELQAMYRRYAACEPVHIRFGMTFLSQEEKIAALLEVARELA